MRNVLIAVLSCVVLLLLLVLFNLFRAGPAPAALPIVAYSDFIHSVDAGDVKAVILQGSSLVATDDAERRSQVLLPPDDPALLPRLLAKDIHIRVRPSADEPGGLARYLLHWLPLLGLLAIFGWGMRQMTRTTKALGLPRGLWWTFHPPTNGRTGGNLWELSGQAA